VVGARGLDGSLAIYEPAENRHAGGILDLSVFPARVPAPVAGRAREIAATLLEAWDVVGVLCVELFVLPGGELVANEVAPRPHNSGHATIDACACSQYEQQVRAICGLPLGSTHRHSSAALANLLGDLWSPGTPDWAAALAEPEVLLHLYGKVEARPGRKMGHLTALGPSPDEALAKAERARAAVGSR
jgi:5-(carboxyamino)imidazole ribonucleotide synthase